MLFNLGHFWLDHPKWSLLNAPLLFQCDFVYVLLLFIRNEILRNVLKINFMQRPVLNFVSGVHGLGIEHFWLSRSLWQLPPSPRTPPSFLHLQRPERIWVRCQANVLPANKSRPVHPKPRCSLLIPHPPPPVHWPIQNLSPFCLPVRLSPFLSVLCKHCSDTVTS